ncbi:Adenylyl-sulfate reductase [thioredoxin] [hydrothermal vent metagenome]|uniref:Adenosine 5'-phosphosulfate reductase n=1 Tax=hydrothermal vent metagenome TaxID=652676 RepID=A0A3B0WBM4_9ZZZZ
MKNISIDELNQQFKAQPLAETLKELADIFDGQKMVFSSSLGLEDQVITAAIFENDLPIQVFTLDTQRLFKETEALITETEQKYQKTIVRFTPNPDAIQEYTKTEGLNGFYESIEKRKKCCYIRKIEPLNRALKGAKIWITGIRQAQSEFRNNMQLFEYDSERDLIKFNPLLAWSTEQLWECIRANQIPFNSLHEKGYPSIGCEPCTRAIKPGEDERAGRWWWENQDQTKQECGLHVPLKAAKKA